MLAVRPEAQGLGLGKRLKLYQRDELLRLGVEEAHWTYDPLVAQNAHLNLNDLGAEIERYVPDMYGQNTGSALHSALGTDRFVVIWRIASSRVEEILAGQRPPAPSALHTAPIITAPPAAGSAEPAERDLPLEAYVRVEVPEDVQQVRTEDVELARRWRLVTRRAFQFYLDRGYVVAGFRRDPTTHRCTYALAAKARTT